MWHRPLELMRALCCKRCAGSRNLETQFLSSGYCQVISNCAHSTNEVLFKESLFIWCAVFDTMMSKTAYEDRFPLVQLHALQFPPKVHMVWAGVPVLMNWWTPYPIPSVFFSYWLRIMTKNSSTSSTNRRTKSRRRRRNIARKAKRQAHAQSQLYDFADAMFHSLCICSGRLCFTASDESSSQSEPHFQPGPPQTQQQFDEWNSDSESFSQPRSVSQTHQFPRFDDGTVS